MYNLNSIQMMNIDSSDELNNYPVDYTGKISVFKTNDNKEIYTKQFLNDGTTRICKYKLEKNYIPIKDKELQKLREEIEELKELLKGGLKINEHEYEQYTSNDVEN